MSPLASPRSKRPDKPQAKESARGPSLFKFPPGVEPARSFVEPFATAPPTPSAIRPSSEGCVGEGWDMDLVVDLSEAGSMDGEQGDRVEVHGAGNSRQLGMHRISYDFL